MAMVNINVKWGREKLSVDVNQEESPLLLKSQLFALTGVAPDRQKVLIKGRTLGDESWNGIKLTEGAIIMMMGSAGEIPQAPVQQTNVQVKTGENGKELILPIGLKNLGNTCYMNSVVQCLKTIPELTASIKSFDGTQDGGEDKRVISSIKSAFEELDKPNRTEAFLPFGILSTLHAVLPQFATRSPQGQLQQQDANECFTELQRLLLSGLSKSESSKNIKDFFRGKFAVTLRNLESKDEPVQNINEDFHQISCFLSQEVKYIQTGIKEKLTEEIEKHSSVLDRNCKYERKALIDRLPAYLSIQMVRFFFKSQSAINAKILKDVKFPLTLDLFELCTPELKTKLLPQRDAVKEMEDHKLDHLRQAKIDGREAKDVEEELEKKSEKIPFSFPEDEGSNNSGFYELQAVITHKGRSSDSGHYVAWVRLHGDQWATCDDDEVHSVHSDQILKLSGGGDWHCAYVLLYGPRRIYKIPPVPKTA